MKLLDWFRETEDDQRKDSNEGIGRIKISNLVEQETENLNCKYLLCCSEPDVDVSRFQGFGRYIVKICDPLRLAQDIASWLSSVGKNTVGQPEWVKVRYDKGSTIQGLPNHAQLAELSYSQKDPKFSWEREWRLVVIMGATSGCASSLSVEIGRKLHYVKPLIL